MPYFSNLAAELLSFSGANLSAGSHFLDVCAGPATFSIAVMKSVGLSHATSIHFVISDFAPGMVAAAEEAVEALLPGHSSNFEFTLADVQNIEMPSNSFDIVGCMFGYFVPDRNKAFSEVFRVCKPGGKVVIGTWKCAGFAFILGDFLTFLSYTGPYSTELAHVCADGEKLKLELAGLGFGEVVVHERMKVFDMPLEAPLLLSLFDNPMIRTQLQGFEQDFLLAEWAKFIRQPDFKYDVDLVANILRVTYTANIVVATK